MALVSIQWLLLYLTPAFVAFWGWRKDQSIIKRAIYMHVTVVLSVAMMSFIGVQLVWGISLGAVLAVIGVSLLAVFLLGHIGAVYIVSSVIQESGLLFAASLLLPVYPLCAAAFATAFVFTTVHDIKREDIFWKPILLLGGPILSIYVYNWLHQPLINIALHILVGTLFINANLLIKQRGDVTLR